MAEFSATGPISRRGKERSSRNAVKHGLNVAITPESDPLFHQLARDLLESGFSHEQTVEAVRSLLEFRRATTVYADTYWNTKYEGVGIEILVEELLDQVMASKSVQLFKQAQKAIKSCSGELKHGCIEAKRASCLQPQIRYQRAAVSKLSKALCRAR